jgi:2C-methyl-D-erythritol 2,4-cyclodiphosphate synthase
LWLLSVALLSSFARAGDVLIHCIVDSILGALGMPDIGARAPAPPRVRETHARSHMRRRTENPRFAPRAFAHAPCRLALRRAGQLFPDTDATWKGASSDRFLLEAMRRMREAGCAKKSVTLTPAQCAHMR